MFDPEKAIRLAMERPMFLSPVEQVGRFKVVNPAAVATLARAKRESERLRRKLDRQGITLLEAIRRNDA